MKHRRIAVLISLLIALIAMFALPLQAQSSNASISSLEFSYNDFGSSDDWAMGWDFIDGTSGATLQVRGGGITATWTSVSINSITLNVKTANGDYTNKTKITFQNLSSYRVGGQAFTFRVRAELQDGSSTNWAQISA